MQKLTIYDISKLAGVSISTVSRVLNGYENISDETRQKVEDVIEKYGYTPQQKMRKFHRKDFFALGLMMDDIRHPYMSELAYAINEELEKWKVNTILYNVSDVEKEFINKMDTLIEKRVNGVILLGSVFENDICKVSIERRYSGYPFVTVNANFALPNVREVMQDQSQGLKDAVQYLHSRGKSRIGFIYYHKSGSDRKKYKGFIEGMQQCNLDPKRCYETNIKTLEAGKKATADLLEKYPDTDAVIYSGDILAVGGVHYLNSAQISIPDKVAIVGFNNSSIARECYPTLTSIDNKTVESGTAAVKVMMNILNNQNAENMLLKCGLEIRESTN